MTEKCPGTIRRIQHGFHSCHVLGTAVQHVPSSRRAEFASRVASSNHVLRPGTLTCFLAMSQISLIPRVNRSFFIQQPYLADTAKPSCLADTTGVDIRRFSERCDGRLKSSGMLHQTSSYRIQVFEQRVLSFRLKACNVTRMQTYNP